LSDDFFKFFKHVHSFQIYYHDDIRYPPNLQYVIKGGTIGCMATITIEEELTTTLQTRAKMGDTAPSQLGRLGRFLTSTGSTVAIATIENAVVNTVVQQISPNTDILKTATENPIVFTSVEAFVVFSAIFFAYRTRAIPIGLVNWIQRRRAANWERTTGDLDENIEKLTTRVRTRRESLTGHQMLRSPTVSRQADTSQAVGSAIRAQALEQYTTQNQLKAITLEVSDTFNRLAPEGISYLLEFYNCDNTDALASKITSGALSLKRFRTKAKALLNSR
jgi:hypothetical protein